MELLFQKQIIQLEQYQTAEQIIEQINTLLNNSYYFSHFVADGKEVYEDPENYLKENAAQIEKLEVIARTAKELTYDILLSAEEYLKRALPELSILTDGFYNNPSTHHWTNFDHMLEGMQWLNQIIISIDQMKEKPANWDEYLKLSATLQNEVKGLEEAVENADHILVADLIQYEIKPFYESLEKEISTTIDTEGTRHDTN
ncbi:hypothetical protein [Domibacillus epiphyticus]|uniref:Uncharacterized protein n=1 Tax=Domibacillus epiphyticus TaxID=1714355 RepID=A0A1V2A4D4_9BACI|nr:hypothetical protein [Domibacillus epiphyticus]OMP65797.1 hypothetical protein BTO28_15575 [Domibacillus epiphyticus]